MSFDKEIYRPYLKSLNLFHEKEDDVLHLLWSMMQHCVDSAFGKTSVQLALQKQKSKKDDFLQDSDIMLGLSHITIKNDFHTASADAQSIKGGS